MEDKNKLTEQINLRCTEKELNMIKIYADIFAGGNVSLWLVYNALRGPFTKLKEGSLEDSRRRIRESF